jgi:mutator family transposase
MADESRMTVADVVANVLASEHGDFVRGAVAIVARELMEGEVSGEIGAGRGEVSAERLTHRNGYRPRGWETRVADELTASVPCEHMIDGPRVNGARLAAVGDLLGRNAMQPALRWRSPVIEPHLHVQYCNISNLVAADHPTMTADELLRLHDDQLHALATSGCLGPAIGRGLGNELVDRVASGQKPTTLKVSPAAATYALHLGLVVRAVESVASGAAVDFDPWPEATGDLDPHEPSSQEHLLYAVGRTVTAIDALEAAYHASTRPGDKGLRGHVELGLALGYSTADVAAYILNARQLARRDTVTAATSRTAPIWGEETSFPKGAY